jgi:hypothetical protein
LKAKNDPFVKNNVVGITKRPALNNLGQNLDENIL